MALSFDQAEEEKKRKLQRLNDITSDTFSSFVNSPIDRNAPSAGTIIGAGAKGLKDIVSTGASVVGESFNKVGSDIAAGYSGEKSYKYIPDVRDTMPGRFQFGTKADIKVPTLKEISNVQRDSELGKMNLATNGNIVTYDIGGNTVSYDSSQKDNQGRTTLERINQNPNRITSAGGLQVDFDAGTDKNVISNYHSFSQQMDKETNDPIAQQNRALAHQQWLDRQAGPKNVEEVEDRRPILTSLKPRDVANYNQAMGAWSARQLEREAQLDKLSIDKEANRINELATISQNKLRDIQGQVAQQPEIQENKPVVIDDYEPNPMNPAEPIKKQRVLIRNQEGNGFIDVTPGQTSFNESQAEIIERLSKMRASKDPRLAAAEAKYKAVFGKLPY